MALTPTGFCEALRPGGIPTQWYDPVFARAAETFGLTPYAFGGDRTPGRSDGPWDCAGWIGEILDAANPPLGDFGLGVHQGYINAERQRQACTAISEGEAQKGDLVFFQGTYETAGASHVGLVWDSANHIMADDHDRGDNTGPGLTSWDDPYWRSHLMSFGRVPRPLQPPPPADPGGGTAATRFSMAPDHQFSFAELWPLIQTYSAQYGSDPRILAGMVQQESTFHNYRYHLDQTGHGLLGLDDNGLRKDFEAWSGLYIGPGTTANIVPVEPQLEFAARQLRRYQDAYRGEGEYVGARAWHAGGAGRNNANGQNYERLIKQRIAELGL